MSGSPRLPVTLLRALAALLVVVACSARAAHAQTETTEYYAYDAIGSVRVVFNAAGAVIGRADYLPFGEAGTSSTGLPTEQFTGQPRDPEAGLDYFEARSYQSRTGRFGQMDPVFAGALENPQRWNRYAYALQAPLDYVDRNGLNAQGPLYRTGTDCSDTFGAACRFIFEFEFWVLFGSGGSLGNGGGSAGHTGPPAPTRHGRAAPPSEVTPPSVTTAPEMEAPPQTPASPEIPIGPVTVAGLPPPGAPVLRVLQQVAQLLRNPSLLTRLGLTSASASAGQQFLSKMQQHSVALQRLHAAAKLQYPNSAGNQAHHFWPKFLGGPANGPTVDLPTAYHKVITQAFREAWPYGGVPPSPQEAARIMAEVYRKYPLW